MHLIRTRGLEFIYGQDTKNPVVALSGIDLEIGEGEFVAIVGHNGSGKSTLARHFNGLLLPTRGQVLIHGIDTRDERRLFGIRQRVGMVFQNPDNQLVATMVEEDVAFGAENLGLSQQEIQQRIDESLALVGMEDMKHKTCFQLSRGQRQLVAIAGVLAMKPACIVLDEPTSLLDPVGREEITAGIKRLNREAGMTIVLITHFMEEALLAQRVLVMDKGQLEMEGSPQEIFAQEERLQEMDLDIPPFIRLLKNLRKRGHILDPDILSLEELMKHLCVLST